MERVKQVKRFENRPLQIFRTPKEGDAVYMAGRSNCFLLKERINTVDDGVIYSAGSGICAKIFSREKLDTYHKEKCIYMVSHKIVDESICWPMQVLCNEKGEFIGYLFQAYQGYTLDYAVLKRAGLDTVFPTGKRETLLSLPLQSLKK